MNLTNALGWTLIHFLWQGAVIAVLLGCTLAALRQAAPRVRYAASFAALMMMLISAAVTFFDLQFSERSSDQRSVPLVRHIVRTEPGTEPEIGGASRSSITTEYFPFLVWAWFGGVSTLSMRSLGGWVVAARLARRYTRPTERYWEERFAGLTQRLCISRPVK